jgi:hypothetical protein
MNYYNFYCYLFLVVLFLEVPLPTFFCIAEPKKKKKKREKNSMEAVLGVGIIS